MDEIRTKRNELLAQTVIKGLESRNMKGYYANDKVEALQIALGLIEKDSKVTMGGSKSVEEIGLKDAVAWGEYNYCDRSKVKDPHEAELFAFDCDYYLGSVNAITNDGVLINIDGNANRVSAYAYGPKHLILIVGMNKVAGDVDAAMKRARNTAAVTNAQRFGIVTPCKQTGACMNCKSNETICCQFLITRFERHADRVHVILVNEDLGF